MKDIFFSIFSYNFVKLNNKHFQKKYIFYISIFINIKINICIFFLKEMVPIVFKEFNIGSFYMHAGCVNVCVVTSK